VRLALAGSAKPVAILGSVPLLLEPSRLGTAVLALLAQTNWVRRPLQLAHGCVSSTLCAVASEHGLRPTAVPSWSHLLRRAAGDPNDALRSAFALARAQLVLRRCRRVGFGPRFYGRCLLSGGEGIEIGDRLLMFGKPVACELSSHDGGRARDR